MIATATTKPRFKAVVPPQKTGYDIVHLAHDEWDNATMQRVADEWFRDHPSCEFVLVNEHAGWSLGFRRDGSIWNTSNDMAVLDKGPRPDGGPRLIQRRPGAVYCLSSGKVVSG